jgi:hypothetical protein
MCRFRRCYIVVSVFFIYNVYNNKVSIVNEFFCIYVFNVPATS